MKVLVLHTLPPREAESGRTPDEFDLDGAAQAIGEAIPGAVVAGIRGELRELIDHLDRHRPDVVFNLCEAPLGRPDLEAHVASLFEWAGVRFTGNPSQTLALCRRKDLVDGVLRQAGVAVPARVEPTYPTFPCIVKPAAEDGSAHLDHDSVCETAEALQRTLARMPGPVVVQEFLPGREFAVSVWGANTPEYVSIGETVFENDLRLITYAAKWQIESADFADTPLFYDSPIDDRLRAAIEAAARGAWLAVGARQVLRVDIRLDAEGKPRVLDVNPNPEMGQGVGISRAVVEAGWEWRDFIHKLVEWA
jgi:D-alanine-D-alanine ligase